MVNIENVGIRPIFRDDCGNCTACLTVCPGYSVDAALATGAAINPTAEEREFGPALEIWEGYASDPQIRKRASSGGILSALALYCLDREDMAFVLHTAMDDQRPWLNKTVTSRSRAELLSRAGSRYAPASPCEDLGKIECSDQPCVFIGKPSDTAAAWKARSMRPALDRNLGLVLTFFCAGEPSTRGTLELLKSFGIEKTQVDSLHYRGDGWPGRFRVSTRDDVKEKTMTYAESWAKLTKFRPFRWHLDPDGLGRVADISCGDAWDHYEDTNNDPGRSIVIVRTTRGREILKRALHAGYVSLQPVGPERVVAAQRHLLARRREIFGRLLAMRLFLIPTPQLKGFDLFDGWRTLTPLHKLRTITGTLKRILVRGIWRKERLRATYTVQRPLTAAVSPTDCHKP